MLMEVVERDPERDYRSAIWNLWGEIVATMNQRGITQTQMAERTGLKQSYLSRTLASPYNLSFRTAFRLCKALDVELVVKAKPKAVRKQPAAKRPAAISHSKPRSRKAVAAHPA